jgi:hypothetical protein
MKTSFYFVLWIIIYPVLGLLNMDFISENSFLFAILAIWGISWFSVRIMPKTILYTRISEVVPILEDIYTCNLVSFRKRLMHDMILEIISAVYLLSLILLILLTFEFAANDLIALLLCIFIAGHSISSSVKYIKAVGMLKANPVQQQCVEIARNVYRLDYSSYHNSHAGYSYKQMLPPRPANYSMFLVFSCLMAVASFLLGAGIIMQVIMLLADSFSGYSAKIGSYTGMAILYGSLATYYGIKDFFAAVRSFNKV